MPYKDVVVSVSPHNQGGKKTLRHYCEFTMTSKKWKEMNLYNNEYLLMHMLLLLCLHITKKVKRH